MKTAIYLIAFILLSTIVMAGSFKGSMCTECPGSGMKLIKEKSASGTEKADAIKTISATHPELADVDNMGEVLESLKHDVLFCEYEGSTTATRGGFAEVEIHYDYSKANSMFDQLCTQMTANKKDYASDTVEVGGRELHTWNIQDYGQSSTECYMTFQQLPITLDSGRRLEDVSFMGGISLYKQDFFILVMGDALMTESHYPDPDAAENAYHEIMKCAKKIADKHGGGTADTDDEVYEETDDEIVEETDDDNEVDDGKKEICKDGKLDEKKFEKEWEKYSMLDERIDLSERSFEARNYYKYKKSFIEANKEVFLLKRDIEINRLMRNELRNTKTSLVKTQKANLLRAMWRLAWVTYDTANSGRSMGKSYLKLFTNVDSLKTGVKFVGSTLKIVRGLSPSNSALAINTKTTQGKINYVSRTGWIETVDSFGDPISTGTAVFEEAVKQNLGSADITPEEIAILRKHYLKNNFLTHQLEESALDEAKMLKKLDAAEEKMIKAFEEMDNWEEKEKKRTFDEFRDWCEE